MMKALVTGAAGFVGRHMMAGLCSRGWDVIGIDIRDVPGIFCSDARKIFSHGATRYDLVVHCAYHVGGRAGIDGEPQFLSWNLELDAKLFDWAVRTEQGRVLYYSSSAAYPVSLQQAGSTISLSEAMIGEWPIQPDGRYGWAKLTGERLADAATLSGLRVHVVRPFSGYGGDQDKIYPFPAILRRVLSGELSVWGPPGQCRDWIHIDDVVGCSLAVVDQDVDGPVNICSGVGVEMGDLAIRMATIAGVTRWGPPKYMVDKPTGVMMRVGDPTRMLEIYRPKIGLDDGISRAIGALD